MQNAEHDGGELPGQDSFLDIVANIVGILILLVMVVGLRAARYEHAPADEPRSVAKGGAKEEGLVLGPTQEQLESKARQAIAARNDVMTKMAKAAAAQRAVSERDAERVEFAAVIASIEEEIEAKRRKMSDDERRGFDLRSKLGAAEHELEKLTKERISLVTAEDEVKEFENLPTPLAASVGEEVHVRLAKGHAQVLPWDALAAAVRGKVENEAWRLTPGDEVEFVAGPVNGFRVRCLVKQRVFRTRDGMVAQTGATLIQFLPEAYVLGEPVDAAVVSGSQLLTEIAGQSGARKPTITVWTYPDSFDEFRTLKSSLYELGYQVAGRPLPSGRLIAGSPRGARSAAQ